MSLRKGSPEPTAEASDPHRGPGPPTSIRTSHARRTNIPLEDSTTHRIQCGWLRRALPPRLAGQPLSVLTVDRVLPTYTVQPPAPHPRRARLRRINWIRRHGTFPSCRLRRKLHGPFSYVAGDAASYAWRRFNKTVPGHAERGIPGAGKEIQERGLLPCDAIMYEQYVIIYYIVGPTCRGPSNHVRASLEI